MDVALIQKQTLVRYNSTYAFKRNGMSKEID